ncbi:MAG: hypothetical protein N2651_06060 [Fimbriimonadales bacterium]|nr:hypothetical protein [Fimbriimonadales bacterium]
MQERWLTGLFFVAGIIAGVLGMRLLGMRTESPAAALPAPPTLRSGDLGMRIPESDSVDTRQALEQGSALGRLSQQFARDTDAPASDASLPTIPAFNAPAPMGSSLPPTQPADTEPLQPLQQVDNPGVSVAGRATLYRIPPFMGDALRASE